MLPHHKEWAPKRSLRRMQQFAKDSERGKARGQTPEQIRERVGFIEHGRKLSVVFDRLDVRIIDLAPNESGTPYGNFQFRCLECGGGIIRVPDDGNGGKVCICCVCGKEIAPYGILKGALTWLALDELRYGEPEKFKRAEYMGRVADS